jgi:hypothetical protein
MLTNDSNCDSFCVKCYYILKQDKNFNMLLLLVYYLMGLRIYSMAVERTNGTMLLLVGTRLMHTLNGRTRLCTFVTTLMKFLEVLFNYFIVGMVINIVYNHLKYKYLLNIILKKVK